MSIRFDDPDTRNDRKKTDKLAAIRDITEILRSKFMDSYEPDTHLTVDERICPYRGNCPFRVYMQSKPDKYGIKIWILA